jgi:hypothetical protein
MRMPDSLLSGTGGRGPSRERVTILGAWCGVSDTVSTPQRTCATKVRTGKAVAHDCPLSAEHTSLEVPGSVA